MRFANALGSFGVSVALFALVLSASCTPSSAAPTDQESGGGSVGQATAGQSGSAADDASAGLSSGGVTPNAGSGGTGGSSTTAPRTITVMAGELDRNHTITRFQLANATGESFTLVDAQGGLDPHAGCS